MHWMLTSRDAAHDGVVLAQELSSDDDEPRKRPAKRRASAGRGRGAAAAEASDDSGYDDGYDSDLMGDDDDRARYALPPSGMATLAACRFTV